ncbi:hypothetical protein [Nocardioides sp.]|uniref:hypothetical protein n=1 Tax=Nocardioides sp. TaxID=35761 RepID=UPI002723FAB9|nr:hypothetical protein [Nocardioides sp.]MDO9456358.1 hypothetical protein [Nocardioides sp.]
MSTDSLRDLLHDRVADETPVDLSARAWRAGRAVRRRRGLAVVGGVAAGAVAVTGVVAWVDPTSPRPVAPLPAVEPSTPTPTPTPTPDAADTSYNSVPVWFSPSQEEERDLPLVEDGPFPQTLDLGVRTKDLVGPALAAFATGDRVLLVGARNSVVSVDVGRLDQVAKPHGYRVPPTSASMLSPDGEHLLFPQDGAVAVYTVGTGAWSSISTEGRSAYGATWLDASTIGIPLVAPDRALRVFPNPPPVLSEEELPRLEPGFDVGGSLAYGPTRSTTGRTPGRTPSSAQAWGMGTGVNGRDGATDSDLVAFETADGAGVLSMTWTVAVKGGRYKDCCPVAGWLDDRTLVYESRQGEPTLVAWTVGTHDFRRVTTIEGRYDVASYASLS